MYLSDGDFPQFDDSLQYGNEELQESNRELLSFNSTVEIPEREDRMVIEFSASENRVKLLAEYDTDVATVDQIYVLRVLGGVLIYAFDLLVKYKVNGDSTLGYEALGQDFFRIYSEDSFYNKSKLELYTYTDEFDFQITNLELKIKYLDVKVEERPKHICVAIKAAIDTLEKRIKNNTL